MSAPTILNLGCGTKTSPHTINIDFSIYQRVRKAPGGTIVARALLRGARREQFESMDDNLLVHDLRKGIPAAASSVDAVYHSHTQEHLERADVPGFLAEVFRVLRPGGIHRIVVPDLEALVREYLESLDARREDHDRAIDRIIGQCVRREASGTSLQPPVRRRLENIILGDARRRGETHQWMWDSLNLTQSLELAGFVSVKRLDAHTSDIPNWATIGLDVNQDGSVYKSRSLYMEARKPVEAPNRMGNVSAAVDRAKPGVGAAAS